MSKLLVSELFYSLQGEGIYQGVPSIFLRTFGCPFKCPGFGLPKGQVSNEVDLIAQEADKYTHLSQLPLAKTGCDSYASWHPAFKHLSRELSTRDIAVQIQDMLPYKQWEDEHLVITGGEPLLPKWQKVYPELLNNSIMKPLLNLTFETNGTQMINNDFYEYLYDWDRNGTLTFSVSPKLSCSGVPQELAIKPEVIKQYQSLGHTYLKFVVGTQEDVEEALDMVQLYEDNGFFGIVYLMPMGGTTEGFYKTDRQVAELALKYGLNYSDRLHIRLFKNAWGT